MRKLGTWGGNLELQAMSELYNRTIEIFAYSLTPMNTFNETEVNDSSSKIRLSYHGNNHYNSIVDSNSHSQEVKYGKRRS